MARRKFCPRLLGLEQRITPDSTLIYASATARDIVWDSLRSKLYITTTSGVIKQYDAVGNSLTDLVTIAGGSLNGADITTDNGSLLVADATVSGGLGRMERVDLSSLGVTTITYTPAFGEIGAWDVAVVSATRGMLTTRYSGSGWTPLRDVTLSSNTLTTRSDLTSVRQDSHLYRSADNSRAVLMESNISSGPVHSYNSATNSFQPEFDTNFSLTNTRAAVSRTGSLIAMESGTAISVFDAVTYAPIQTLTNLDGGVAFDPTRNRLYGVNTTTDEIVCFSTDTWQEMYRRPILENVSSSSGMGTGALTIAGDTAYFISTAGVRKIDLPPSGTGPSVLKVQGFPTFTKTGQPGSFTVTALQDDGTVATTFTGTVSFTSTDGTASLPMPYPFTAADMGTKTFSATFNTVGTFSLTVSSSGLTNGTQSGIQIHNSGPNDNLSLPLMGVRDLAFDSARNLIYASTDHGTIERFDVTTMTLLPPWMVGSNFYGIDITPDGNSLLVAEGQAGATGGLIRRVDLTAGAVTTLSYTGDAGTYDIASFSNNIALVTARFAGSGWVPLRQLDLTTNAITNRPDLTSVRQDTRFGRAANGSRALLMESNISSGPLHVFTATSNSFGAEFDTGGFHDSNQASVSRDGQFIAMEFGAAASVFTPTYQPLEVLAGIDGGLTFDPNRDRLYGLNATTDQLIAFNSSNWAEAYRLSIGLNIGTSSGFGDGITVVGGNSLYVVSGSIVRKIALPTDGGPATTLTTTGYPTYIRSGQSGTFTVTALAADGSIDTNFTGQVNFSATGSASLPSSYTFTPADQGKKSFGATFNATGTFSLTAASSGLSSGTETGIVVHNLLPSANVAVPVTGARDLVYDSTRNLAYISTDHGTVERFDPATVTLLSPWQVGASLYGIDISADGNTLVVADGQSGATGNFIRRVELNTGTKTTIGYTGDAGTYDLVTLANGTALFTARFAGSGWVAMRQLDLATNIVTVRADIASVRQDTLVSRSADRSRAVFGESNISSGPLFTYSAASDSFSSKFNSSQFMDTVRSAVSRDGLQVAMEYGTAATSVFAPDYTPLENIAGIDGGVSFDSLRDRIYGINSASDVLVAYDTNTWKERYRLAVGENVGTSSGFGAGGLVVDATGNRAFLTTATGFRSIPLPANTMVASQLSVAGFPAYIPSTTSGTFTVTALDPAGNVDVNFTGTVSFSSSAGSASLPGSYAFAPADQGRKTFSASITSIGTFTLTVASAGLTSGTQSNIQVHNSNPVTKIPVADYRGMVYDTLRDTLYIATDHGVERYSPTTRTLLSPLAVNGQLRGIDISPDGTWLLAADGTSSVTGGFIRRVNLVTGAIDNLGYVHESQETGAWDVAIFANGKALFTTQFSGSGWTPLRQITMSTGAIAKRTDLTVVRQNSMISRGFDRTRGAITESNISSGPLHNYSSGTDSFPNLVNTGAFLDTRPSSVSRDGNIITLETGTGIATYSGALVAGTTLSGPNGGMVFDPLQDRMYAAVNPTTVRVYNTSSWSIDSNLTVTDTIPTSTTFNSETLAISDDGRWLFVDGTTGINVLRLVVPTAMNLVAAPTTLAAGQTLTLTATVSGGLASERTGELVTFKYGTTTVGTAALNGSGVATLPVNNLPAGPYVFTATYGGDANYLTSTSTGQAVTLTVPAHVVSATAGTTIDTASIVRRVTLTLDRIVTAPTSVNLVQLPGNIPVTNSVASQVVGLQTILTITFSGALTDASGSLVDGQYRLTLSAPTIADANGILLDGDNNGFAGGDYIMNFYRLLGDANGDHIVDGVDFGLFRQAFNTNNAAFDFDGNGVVDGLDFGRFRGNFGAMI